MEIYYVDTAKLYVEIVNGNIVQFCNLDGSDLPSAAMPKSCKLALVFDPEGSEGDATMDRNDE